MTSWLLRPLKSIFYRRTQQQSTTDGGMDTGGGNEGRRDEAETDTPEQPKTNDWVHVSVRSSGATKSPSSIVTVSTTNSNLPDEQQDVFSQILKTLVRLQRQQNRHNIRTGERQTQQQRRRSHRRSQLTVETALLVNDISHASKSTAGTLALSPSKRRTPSRLNGAVPLATTGKQDKRALSGRSSHYQRSGSAAPNATSQAVSC